VRRRNGFVLVLESGHAERCPPASLREALRAGSVGVLQYLRQVRKAPAWRVGDAEGAVESLPQIGKTRARRAAGPNYLPPLQGGSSLNVFLGLKPQAESCSPFGTKNSLTPVRKIKASPMLWGTHLASFTRCIANKTLFGSNRSSRPELPSFSPRPQRFA
jgi:hypothetical protein